MADLFENIVTGWLNSQGYFVIQGLKVGSRELDILAIKVVNGKITNSKHVEVTCSSEPIGYLGTDKVAGKKESEQIEKSVKEYVKKKYKEPSIKEKAESLLGKEYDRLLVYGCLKDKEIQLKALKENGIIAIPISDIMSKLRNIETITTDIRRFQQLLKLYNQTTGGAV